MRLKDAPNFGKYVKLKKYGVICKWKAYSPESETLWVELPSGVSCLIPQHEIGVLTADEELEFLGTRGGRASN
jgi:hypothetical protein